MAGSLGIIIQCDMEIVHVETLGIVGKRDETNQYTLVSHIVTHINNPQFNIIIK